MDSEAMRQRWAQLAEEAFTGVAAWRQQHPQATFREIEAAIDERLAAVRARMLEDAALASAATVVSGQACPSCGQSLRPAGRHRRQVLTTQDQVVTLERQYGQCPACGAGLFPPG
jgi:hypothetical protein